MTLVAQLADQLDPVNITGLGIGAVLLGLVFRTLWKQEGGWRAVLDAAREDAKEARTDAASARIDAAAARTDAAIARQAEARCQLELGKLTRRFDDLLEARERTEHRLAELEQASTNSGEIPITPPPAAGA